FPNLRQSVKSADYNCILCALAPLREIQVPWREVIRLWTQNESFGRKLDANGFILRPRISGLAATT
ncbi:MAG: hypothetical protein AB7E74_23590, partial [Pirellulales bacterium]